jgi:mannose-1-phosphate guanylyltransferase
MKAMILAAGLGTRLRPYTLLRPKPLFPVLGEPLLLRIVGQLRKAGFTSIVINAYHLAEQLAALFQGQSDIHIQHELVELGTGGGLRMALPHFHAEPVLVTNGDIYHDIDYGAVYTQHQQGGHPLTMVMHDYPRFNSVRVEMGQVLGFAGQAQRRPGTEVPGSTRLAFTGIHCLDPALLHGIPPAHFYSIIDRYQSHLDDGGQIQAMVVRDHFWQDIGTIDDYLDLHHSLLRGSRPFRVADTVTMGRNVLLEEWGYVGAGVSIGDNVTLRRVVVWDGAVIPAGATIADSLVTA